MKKTPKAEEGVCYPLKVNANLFSNIGGIYIIICSGNNKIYIGRTHDFNKRISGHLTSFRRKKHNKHLQNSYNKYGHESFIFKILEISKDTSEEVLIKKEQYFLDKTKCYYNSIGFNISLYAQNSFNQKNRAQEEETKRKTSQTMKWLYASGQKEKKTCDSRTLSLSLEKFKNFYLKNPFGDIIFIENKFDFKKDNPNLDMGSVIQLIKGEIKQHKGWTLPETKIEEYKFLYPEGKLVKIPFGKLTKFAIENNLNMSTLSNIWAGTFGSTRGWSRYDNNNYKRYVLYNSKLNKYEITSVGCFQNIRKKYSIYHSGVSQLISGEKKMVCGWVLKQIFVKEEEICLY